MKTDKNSTIPDNFTTIVYIHSSLRIPQKPDARSISGTKPCNI
ncbi:hypothetical protein [Bartonella henselae]|nr:hypothetical protein [Bartonella henselae]